MVRKVMMSNNGHTTYSAISALRGQRVVVKLGGEVMLKGEGLQSLAADITHLTRDGVKIAVVHGGGPQADALAARLGHPVRKVGGRRITDDDTLEIAKMVYAGSANVEIVAALKKQGGRGVGLSGVDGNLLLVTRRPLTLVKDPTTDEEEWVDFGHVGDIVSVDTSLLDTLWASGYIPVVAPLAADAEGNLYNVNADTIAQALAIEVGAARLVLVTNVPGILRNPNDPATLIPVTTPAELGALVESGVISGGMLPKVQNCITALRAGVASVQMLDGTTAHPVLLDSLAGGKSGTLVISSEQGATIVDEIW